MLKSLNFAVISCEDCGEIIKIEPSQPFEPLLHECKINKAKVKAAPKKAPAKKK